HQHAPALLRQRGRQPGHRLGFAGSAFVVAYGDTSRHGSPPAVRDSGISRAWYCVSLAQRKARPHPAVRACCCAGATPLTPLGDTRALPGVLPRLPPPATPWVTPRSDLGRAGGDRAGACHPVTPHQGYAAWSRSWSVSSASGTMPNLPCPSSVSRPTSTSRSSSLRNHERERIPEVTRSLKSGAEMM